MKNMTLENIATVCGVYHGDPVKSKQEVTNIVIDSRKIEPGGLFIATKGERVDGHSFIGQVMEKGALAVVSEQELPDGEFPTVSYPNPEAPEAFELALKLAKEKDADLVLATDPDADRMGVAVRGEDGKTVSYTHLTLPTIA